MTTTAPQQVVNARRIAGVILVVATLGTVIMLVILFAQWSTQPPTVVAAGTPPTTPAVLTSVPTQPSIAPPVSPDVALQQQVDNDRQQVEALVGYWVPQLSSKTVGLPADGIIYGYGEILDHFHSVQARYPQALLLSSDDYTSFKMNNYWVIVIPTPYSSGADANSWCDTQGIDSDNCFAKLLTHSGSYEGTTVSRK
ncbi:MAG: hypothetical protein LC808_01645 [Actinobacteria bacterium]|nr:hypothetical protein [Actinomycetota bacterium]